MLFTSPIFLFYFLPLSLLIHRYTTSRRKGAEYNDLSRYGIFLMTLVFYGFYRAWWLIQLLICIGMDFVWASLLARETNPGRRKLICSLSIIQNLGMLATFKYWNEISFLFPFFTNIGATGTSLSESILPAGISFYTFESMSFVIDVYRREVEPPKKPHEFFAFIGMYPRFIAGPIVRYRAMVSQFTNYRGMEIESGLFVFLWGFFLKTCFADNFGVFVPYAFDAKHSIDFVGAWVGSVAYAFQIYFDFSGYSLMAIGLGRCFGFQFPMNFNRPYTAVSLQDFWRRWHISLSTWLRDYLYISLGGSRHGKLRTYLALFLTMLIGGIWHGAGWPFFIWGGLHGAALCIERALTSENSQRRFGNATTLVVVLVGWVFFRAGSAGEGLTILTAMVKPWTGVQAFNPEAIRIHPVSAFFSILGIGYCFLIEPKFSELEFETRANFRFSVRAAGLAIFAFSLMMVFSEWEIPFLYFRF